MAVNLTDLPIWIPDFWFTLNPSNPNLDSLLPSHY